MKVGLSEGYEMYLFQNGNSLYQNSSPQLSDAQKLNLNKEQSDKLSPTNMQEIFAHKTGYKIISKSKPQPVFRINFDKLFMQNKTQAANSQVRLLLDMQGQAFWISVPKSLMYDDFGKLQIHEGSFYNFLLNLKRGYQGIPVQNDPKFGYIIKPEESSSILKLNIKAYLSNPKKYLNRSLGGSSVYIIHGKVRKIRYKSGPIY